MNTYYFKKELYSNREITKEQLKAVHANLLGLGYRKTYQEFYFDLSEYCEQYLSEDAGLLSKEAKPVISEYLLQLLETLTQPNLDSRIFALSSLEKRSQTYARVPVLYIRRQEALEKIFALQPELEDILKNSNTQDFIMGYASPVYEETEYPPTVVYPREETISEIRIGKKERTVLDNTGERSTISEPVKVSFMISTGDYHYEFPLYWNGQDTGMIRTTGIPVDEKIFVEKAEILPIEDFEPLAKQQNSSHHEKELYTTEYPRSL